jgi:ABC-type polysaccharide/polyol phosphate transport system ATPase subunit
MKVISVQNVSKKFILAHDRPKSLADAARGMLRRKPREDFWAVKDVSFEVEQGEALGIIGHNGAGKSTMLKLLTGIMQPTRGRIRTRGRVSALIEVGAGFHQEMTGRENVYLNGAILGMTRREIDRKLDEIVDFAELEQFIDTPVKRYSSGMYARLGFAVAAHVEPEILIVDEVLSVGDAAFQKKCMDRMRAIRGQGCTVVFVSHNFSAVATVCDTAIGLAHGTTFLQGTPTDVIAAYRDMGSMAVGHPSEAGADVSAEHADSEDFVITSVECNGSAKQWVAVSGGECRLRLHYQATSLVPDPEIAFRFTDADGVVVAQPCTVDYGQCRSVQGLGYVDFAIDRLPLRAGNYTVEAFAFNTTGTAPYDYGRHLFTLRVVHPEHDIGPGIRYGLIRVPGEWIWPEDGEGHAAPSSDAPFDAFGASTSGS